MYGVCKLLLELVDGGMAAGKDAIVDGSKVGGAFLELANACSYEFFYQEWFGKVRDKEGGLCDVKWKVGSMPCAM